ncbi:MAG: hypothetical protein ACWA44_06700 [Thiotrichales bacterium]
MKISKTVFFAATAIICQPALANPLAQIPELANVFDYDYAQATITGYDVGGNGLSIGISRDITNNVNLTGSFSNASDYIALSAGAGYHYELTNISGSDLRLFGGLERGEFNVGAGTIDTSDTGLFGGVGIRTSASETLELAGEITYHTIWNGDLSIMGGARLQLNQQFDLVFDYTIADNDFFNIGARMYF